MYYVRAQGVDEHMINVHYYYYDVRTHPGFYARTCPGFDVQTSLGFYVSIKEGMTTINHQGLYEGRANKVKGG